MTLNELKQGERCTVTSIGGDGALRQHFLDMGVIPGVEMELVKLAPMGDPAEFRLRGYELTLRMDDARRIRVQRVFMPRKAEPQEERPRHSRHPGLGEDGVLHNRARDSLLRAGGKPELRKNHAVQPAHRRPAARREFSRRHG